MEQEYTVQIKEWKRLAREEIRRRISSLDLSYCRASDISVFHHVINLEEYIRAKAIFCFVGTRDEIDTKPIILHALENGKAVGVPKCRSKGVMDVWQIKGLEDLETGSYGLMEPRDGCAPLMLSDIDLGLIPCMSCDPAGRRLGHGGGYYDRCLAKGNFPSAALCRGRLMMGEIKTEVFDRSMDLVITEEGIIRISRSRTC